MQQYPDTFESLISDVEYFTLKFDYRNTDKPWGTSKNSIQRSMRFLSSDGRDFDEQQNHKFYCRRYNLLI